MSIRIHCRPSLSRCAILSLALGLGMPAIAADKYSTDRKGGSDSAVVGRFKGSTLYSFGSEKLATTSVVIDQKGKAELLPVEGKVSTKLYLASKEESPLLIYRNYKGALEAAGFQTLYACETDACQKNGDVQNLIHELPRKARWVAAENGVEGTFNSGNQPGFHYYSGKRNGAGGPTYVTVAIAKGSDSQGVMRYVRQFVQIVEPAVADLGNVKVDAQAIEAGLKRDGKIAFYGVNFDTNKAELRDDSTAQLAEMATALKSTPAMKVFIVGHTDNQGELAANTGLSQKRAEAVVAALSGKYGIAPARLLARGVANLAPVSTNDNEEGRAKNRRVEMVVR